MDAAIETGCQCPPVEHQLVDQRAVRFFAPENALPCIQNRDPPVQITITGICEPRSCSAEGRHDGCDIPPINMSIAVRIAEQHILLENEGKVRHQANMSAARMRTECHGRPPAPAICLAD